MTIADEEKVKWFDFYCYWIQGFNDGKLTCKTDRAALAYKAGQAEKSKVKKGWSNMLTKSW